MKTINLLVAVAAVAITGCASGGSPEPSPARIAQTTPALTQSEKDQMSTEEKVAIYNTQQEERNQIVCRKITVTGTHRKRTVCRSVEQMRLEQEEARRAMQDIQTGNVSSTGDN